jgi:uncharacterized membrane protein
MGVVDDEMDRDDFNRDWGKGRGPAYPGPPLVRFSAIGEAWGLVLQRWPLWVLTTLVVLAAYSAVSALVVSFFGVRPIVGARPFWIGLSTKGEVVPFVLSTVVIAPFLGGMFRIACRQVRGQTVGLETLFSVVDVLPQLLLGSFLYGLATFLGLCAFVLPMFVVSGVLMFTLPLIVDARLDATEALSRSWHALKSQWLVAALFHAAVGFVASLGACCCGIGLIVTAPLYCTAIAVLYRDFFVMK